MFVNDLILARFFVRLCSIMDCFKQNTDQQCLVRLPYASAANLKLFSLIHNLTSNFTSATMPPSWTEFTIDCVAFLVNQGKSSIYPVINHGLGTDH